MPSDILIIPNRNSTTAAPVMQFSGSQGNTIRLEVLTSGSVAFLGKSGSLFSISDNFSGSLMAVGDISGLPILEVFSDDRVVMGRFNSNTLVVTGSFVGVRKASPLVPLDVSGSVLISGSLRVADAATDTLVISGSNMGIGKVPSAEAYIGAGSRAKLDVNGDTVISGSITIQPGVGSNSIYANGPFGIIFMHNGSSRGSIAAVQSQGMSVTSVESGQPLTLGAGNTAKVYIFDSGNVSINKSTSNARLDVNGNTIITGSLTVTDGIQFKGPGSDILHPFLFITFL